MSDVICEDTNVPRITIETEPLQQQFFYRKDMSCQYYIMYVHCTSMNMAVTLHFPFMHVCLFVCLLSIYTCLQTVYAEHLTCMIVYLGGGRADQGLQARASGARRAR